MILNYLIPGGFLNNARTLRIYECRSDYKLGLSDYRNNPSLWSECGHMTVNDGIVKSFIGSPETLKILRECEPILVVPVLVHINT